MRINSSPRCELWWWRRRKAEKAGERTDPIAGEQPDGIVGVDEVSRFGWGAHIEYAENSRLEREFPLAI